MACAFRAAAGRMNMPGKRIRALLIVTPLLAFLLYAALNWFRLEETTKWVQMGPEAQRDPYLAYKRLLKKMNADARVSDTPSSLETAPEGSVVFLASRRLVYMSNERVTRIIAWVERGGTLVLEAEGPGIDDPLLEAFGVQRVVPDPKARPSRP